jgi:hypothetical protein
MSKNEITGDRMVSKPVTDAYAEGHERIFGKKKTPPPVTKTCMNCGTHCDHKTMRQCASGSRSQWTSEVN